MSKSPSPLIPLPRRGEGKILLYSDNPSKSLKIEKVVEFLNTFGIEAKLRGDLFQFLDLSKKDLDEYKDFLDLSRVGDIEKPVDKLQTHKPEREYFQTGKDVERFLYDGNWFQRILFKFFPPQMINSKDLHLIYTDKLFGTFGSKRYHARVVLTGEPALISTSGLVEAPARPREYYFAKASLLQSGKDLGELDEIYKDKFLDYDDERITKVISAYTLQPILYHFSGKEFCDNKVCSLFNSHWQEDVLSIQYEGGICSECNERIKKSLSSKVERESLT